MPPAPNVVLWITHDTGRFVAPYVDTVVTPHCERLAREGVRFDRMFTPTPLCSPSRSAIVTSRYPHQNGVMGLTTPRTGGFDLAPGQFHAAELFADAGYESVLCGFAHETPHWYRHGFCRHLNDDHADAQQRDLRNYGRIIGRWLDERDADRPLYLQIGTHETHREFGKFDTPPDASRGVTVPTYLEDTQEVRREMAALQGAVRRLDEGLGHILEALDSRGLGQNTIFVFTTDHGIDMPMAKGTFFDPGIETFCFLRYPDARWQTGRAIPEMLSQIDLLPTLLELTGLDDPPDIEGRSLVPLLEGRPMELADGVFLEKTYHDTYDPTRGVRTERYKYLRHFEVNIFQDLRLATETRRHFIKGDWIRRAPEELYDLQADPHERHNLADDPACAQVREQLSMRVLEWMRRTDDPLLKGPVPSPYYAQLHQAFRQ